MTDHQAIRDSLELAAALPHGLDEASLADGPSRAEVEAHLATCPSCAAEADRLAELSAGLREIVRADDRLAAPVPPLPDDLRDRTLAFVREVGRPRGASAQPQPSSIVRWPVRARREVRRPSLAWALAAAALVVGLVGGGIVVGGQNASAMQAEKDRTVALAAFNVATVNLEKQADVRRVVLSGVGASTASGMLLYSSATGDMVVGVLGLARPSAGQAVACWLVAANGTRTQLGTMRFDGSLASWSGWSSGVYATRPGDRFEVSLVGGTGAPSGPALLAGTVPAS